MLPLRLLWVNGTSTGPRESWRNGLDAVCHVREIDIGQLDTRSGEEDWELVCFNFDFPELGGLKRIPQTKQCWPSTPIVMFTMHCSADLAIWALRVRVFDVLVKPVLPQEIERCLARVFEAVRARRMQSERRPQSYAAQIPTEARYRLRTSPSARLQRAIAYIDRHYRRHVPEFEVARVCEMSPSRFCREFKAAFGMTFVEYLSRHRVSEAQRLLGNRSMAVTDVAAAVGFTDPSYFTRVFRKVTGHSPSAFRELQPPEAAGPALEVSP